MQQYIHYGSEKYEHSLFKDIVNNPHFINKPKYGTGLWASPKDAIFGWIDYCKKVKAEGSAKTLPSKSFVFSLTPDARLFVIDNQSDLDKLPLLSSELPTSAINYEEVSKFYDAILVTLEGLLDCSSFPSKKATLLFWDCESLLVLNKNIIVI